MVRTTPTQPLSSQYHNWLEGMPCTRLVGRDSSMSLLISAAQRNANPSANNKPFLLVAGGPAGSGKSRMGYEALSLWATEDARKLVAGDDSVRTHYIPLFVDLSNGLSFLSSVDSEPSECLGARLAAKALGLSLWRVKELNGGTLKGLDVENVLEAMVQRLADQEGAGFNDVVLFGLHLDEYQALMDDVAEQAELKISPVGFMMQMLGAVSDYMKDTSLHKKLGVKIVFLPVATGTPYRGVDILWTKWLQRQDLRLQALDEEQARRLFADALVASLPGAEAQLSLILKHLASSLPARFALLDVGYRPRLLALLAERVRARIKEDASRRGVILALGSVNWQSALDAMEQEIVAPQSAEFGHSLAVLSLLQVPVRVVFRAGKKAETEAELAVQAAERRGEVELVDVLEPRLFAGLEKRSSRKDFRLVRLPYVQTVLWGGVGLLPPEVRDVPVIDWSHREQEQYVAYLLAARLVYWAEAGQGAFVGDLIPGSRGAVAALNLKCWPSRTCDVYTEVNKFLIDSGHRPEKSIKVDAWLKTDGSKTARPYFLTKGVYLGCYGNYLIGCRLSVPLGAACVNYAAEDAAEDPSVPRLHNFVQAKQTRAGRRMSLGFIESWANAVRKATKKWTTGGDKVVMVVVSALDLRDDDKEHFQSGAFFDKHPDLLIVTKDELHVLLPPSLLARATWQTSQRRKRRRRNRGRS